MILEKKNEIMKLGLNNMNNIKKIISITTILLICFIVEVCFIKVVSAATNKMYGRIALTGGTSSVDNILYADLSDNDMCMVITTGNLFYLYRFESSSADAESSPDIIEPNDVGANNGRWLLVNPTTSLLTTVYDTGAEFDALFAAKLSAATIGTAYDTEAELKALMSVSQSISVANAAALTPTPGYKWLDISLNCEDATTSIGTGGVTLVETGMITDAYIKISNTSSGADDGNVCTFAYVASNFEWPGGTGLTISMLDGESIWLHWETDRYKVIVNNTSTQWVSGIASKTPIEDDADDFAAEFASISGDTSNMYGGLFVCDGSGTAALPNVTAGMNFGVHNRGAVTPVFEPLATGTDDTIILNGTSCGQGKYITSAGAATDIASFRAAKAADTWEVVAVGYTCEP